MITVQLYAYCSSGGGDDGGHTCVWRAIESVQDPIHICACLLASSLATFGTIFDHSPLLPGFNPCQGNFWFGHGSNGPLRIWHIDMNMTYSVSYHTTATHDV